MSSGQNLSNPKFGHFVAGSITFASSTAPLLSKYVLSIKLSTFLYDLTLQSLSSGTGGQILLTAEIIAWSEAPSLAIAAVE